MPLARLLLFLLCLVFPSLALAGAVSVLPGPPVVGDGKSTATVRIWAPGIQGTDKVRVSSTEGRVGAAEIGADGVITVNLIPPSLKAARDLNLVVKIQGAALRVDESVAVPMVPPYAGTLKVTFDPPEFVAGNSGVLVRVTPDASTPQSAEGRRMLGVASTGTLDAFVPAGDGTYVSRWTPPQGLTRSRTVMITVADAAAPDRVMGWAPLPLLVKQSITLNAPPNSSNMLYSGDKEWGPMAASPAGTVAFDVELHPARTSARLLSVGPGSARVENQVELPVDEYNRVSFFPLPSAVPADPQAKVTLYFVATKRSGEPLTNAPVTVRATAGAVTPATPTGKAGVYTAVFTPPEQPGEALFTAEVEGSKAEARIRVVPPLPVVSLSAEPEELPKGVSVTTVTARVKDARGAGIVGRPPELTVEGGTRPSKPTDNKDGSYTAKVTLTSKDGYMLITADPPVEASGLSPSRLVMWTARGAIPANGTETMAVTVAALDAFNMPVAGVKLKLAVPRGDGTLPPEVTTNAKGLVRVTYRGGTTPGPVTLRADGAGLWTETLVFQQGPGSLAPAPVPVGSPEYVDALIRWQSAAPALVVSRAGTVPMTKVGPPAVVTLSTVPPYTTPGAAILVVARVTDAAGLAVTKQKLSINASLGTVGAIKDNGDGSYTFPLQLPAGQDGPLTLGATVGAAQGSVVLPTLATMNATPAAAVSGAPAAGGGDQPASARAARTPRAPRASGGGGGMNMPSASGDGAKLRASLNLGVVARKYLLLSSGEQYVPEQAFFKTNAVFGAPALDLRAHGWAGNFGGGLDLRGYTDRVEVGGDEFTQLGWSGRLDFRYRYPFLDTLHAYGVAGVHRFNGLVFLYADETKASAELISKGLWGARLGVGGILEMNPIYLDVQFAETFSPWPVDTYLGFNLGVDLQGGLTAYLTYEMDVRTMTFDVDGEEVEVKDRERPLLVGVGYRL